MKIDNHTLDPDRPLDPKEGAFWKKIAAIVVKESEMTYADIVCAYRQIEEEFVNYAGYNEWWVLETKRRIAEYVLTAARDQGQPFEVCRDNWNALVELGFSSIYRLCSMAWFYADSCMFNAQYDVGLEVLDQVTTEIHRRLEEPGLTNQAQKYYNGELASLKKLREGLAAHKSSAAEGMAWDEREEAEYDARDVNWTERTGRNRELDIELDNAMDSIAHASWSRSFAETARDYRQLETDFVARLQGDDEFFVPETRRRINSAILMDAQKHKQPFDVCRDVWNELARFDFTDIFQKCAMAWFYADCCRFNKQADAGLAVIEPRIAELQKHVREDTDADADTLERYQETLSRLEKLRDKLKALNTL